MKKLKSAFTDSGLDTPGLLSPGVVNLLELLQACGKIDEANSYREKFKKGEKRYDRLKSSVADSIIELTKPMRERKIELLENRKEILEQVRESCIKARQIAAKTILNVKEKLGITV